jgi:hypothetical protein
VKLYDCEMCSYGYVIENKRNKNKKKINMKEKEKGREGRMRLTASKTFVPYLLPPGTNVVSHSVQMCPPHFYREPVSVQ